MVAYFRTWSLPWLFVVLSFPFIHQGCGGFGFFIRPDSTSALLSEAGAAQAKAEESETSARLDSETIPKQGRLDLTVADRVFDYSSGEVLRHLAGFDSLLDRSSVDILGVEEGLTALTPHQWKTPKSFVLLVANEEHSPGAMLEINGRIHFARDYASKLKALNRSSLQGVPIFTMSDSPKPGEIPLKKLSVLFLPDALNKGEVINVDPACVKRNHPGPKGEYRDGALTLQAVSTDRLAIDPLTRTAAPAAELLWEVTVFGVGHESRCL
ncbi:MAG: hypothetical protein H6626_05570 [Pseudobdellovibrionaceae bacterium]|nr:hypothetical protein [Bdellovibrionales bacterium]USN48563.1 MAG: hypothetical protein H6626_05570 [Pseudobdellovibrionaceae bacterium]